MKYKHILDSVHGYIEIPEDICDHIIDTEQFQRLRRVEQTSIRSVFPCARHDRFMHSLGVYHIGHKIVTHLKNFKKQNEPEIQKPFYTDEERDLRGFDSYEIACLLHDVCHSPFSHTFEDFYEKNKLRDELINIVDNKTFTSDFTSCFKSAKPHEIMSAMMIKLIYEPIVDKQILRLHVDYELVVRMIVGCKYQNKEKCFENALIELIHGQVDADGMDYACRDVWASGYSTSTVDLERLITSIMIISNKDNNLTLAFDAKAKNEIEGFLNVKTFQYDYVFSHHTILYEQEILIRAMQSAAMYHFTGKIDYYNQNERENSLRRLCNWKTFYGYLVLPKSSYPLHLPTDDDFVALMKYIPDDMYVRQWFSRKYECKPIWKTRAEWLRLFPVDFNRAAIRTMWFKDGNIKKLLLQFFPDVDINKYVVVEANPKFKVSDAQDLYLKVSSIDEPLKFKELYKEEYPHYSSVEIEKNMKLQLKTRMKVVVVTPIKTAFIYLYVENGNEELKVRLINRLQQEYQNKIQESKSYQNPEQEDIEDKGVIVEDNLKGYQAEENQDMILDKVEDYLQYRDIPSW